jgi:four helix bundle protein
MERGNLEDLEIYNMSMEIGEIVWDLVLGWDNFAKNSFGYQWVKSADSITANLSEGYGRFHYKENRQFCYIYRGSLYETKTWLTKAKRRKLIEEKIAKSLLEQLNILLKKLNSYIKYIESKI